MVEFTQPTLKRKKELISRRNGIFELQKLITYPSHYLGQTGNLYWTHLFSLNVILSGDG